MAKARFIPVLNCLLDKGNRHAIVVWYDSFYQPQGIGDGESPRKKTTQTCYDHPGHIEAEFNFRESEKLKNTGFEGIEITCKVPSCSFNSKERS